ncbi:hypothetical protein DPM19_19225 [Actinomadura craniellae]|uniref:Uncharacterized protein n=1 Tax=Actinomadura craniellae TaxID=2231787 RepID=A0A365H451_9ACTN|nr:hypothetical protein [Actinomadura craniellae]RAY13786.1 hypothetical protein DPM19_19225 [Actinomadura craniellae]
MDRGEASVFHFVAGAGCVFVLALAFKGVAVSTASAFLAGTVALWSLHTRIATGMALGLVAWLLCTGFVVNGSGELAVTGVADGGRLGLFVAAGLAGALAGRLLTGNAPDDAPPPRQATGATVVPLPRAEPEGGLLPPCRHRAGDCRYGAYSGGRTLSVVRAPAGDERSDGPEPSDDWAGRHLKRS